MSQHSDLLTLTISKGIARKEHATTIVNDFVELLEALDYGEDFTDLKAATEHAYVHAKWMLSQKDGLYGAANHWHLDKFITELWCANQWLAA